jgi:magnesium transporter
MIIRSADGSTETGDESLIAKWRRDSGDWLWLDLIGEPAESEAELLIQTFDINPLAIADAQRKRHPPKAEMFANSVFLLLRDLLEVDQNLEYSTQQLAFFVGDGFLITRREQHTGMFDPVWRAAADPQDKSVTAGVVLYKLARASLDHYTRSLLAIEQRLDGWEEEMLSERGDRVLPDLIAYSGNLKKFRRNSVYQYAALKELMGDPNQLFGEHFRHEVNDLAEQAERHITLATLYQELIADLINGHISLASHRLNHVMKVLTIVTVLFLPLGIIAGIYGMNFEYIPELRFRYGYFVALAAMVTVVVTLLATFRRKGWL